MKGTKPKTKPTPKLTGDPWLDEEITACATDPDRFNSVMLAREYTDTDGTPKRAHFWRRQREICKSYMRVRQTAVKTGNGVGKTFCLVGLALHAFFYHPDCKVVLSAPTLGQLEGAVWGELESAYRSAYARGLPLGGKLRSLTLEQDASWRLECFGSGSVESKSGRHAGKLFAFIDEASGTPPPVDEAIDSLNPSTIVRFGNPLRPEGKFYDTCQNSAGNPHVNVIQIPSTESPDIHLPRSPRGMADATWLESARHEYGEESIWFLSHVLAEFPNEISEGLLPIAWLEQAAQIIYVPAGEPWISVDVAEGRGGDESGILCRDDNGVCRDGQGLGWECSNRWNMETLAERVRVMMDRFGVQPGRIVYDAGGPGADFHNRLQVQGIFGAKPYRGGNGGGDRYEDLRSACGWAVRQRLDPNRHKHVPGGGSRMIMVRQEPFSLPPELLRQFRKELQGVRYSLKGDTICLEPKAETKKRIKRSPTFLDCLSMSYAFPRA